MLRDSEEVKTSFFVYFGGDHCTPGYIGKGVNHTMLTLPDWTEFSRKVGTDAHTKMGPEHTEGPAQEGQDLPFW